MILEHLHPQWVHTTDDFFLPIPSSATNTLSQRQEASLRHFHRVTKSLRVPTGYTFLTRLHILSLPLFVLYPQLRQHIQPLREYTIESMWSRVREVYPVGTRSDFVTR